MPFEDQMQFLDRSTKVAAYYSTIRPFPGGSPYDGQNVTQEATADMGGLRVTLSIASKFDGFDYDAYFRKYAEMWQRAAKEDEEKYVFLHDGHPLAYLRVNVALQQFEEFYSTYNVKNGDAMYLAPEKRIAVW